MHQDWASEPLDELTDDAAAGWECPVADAYDEAAMEAAGLRVWTWQAYRVAPDDEGGGCS